MQPRSQFHAILARKLDEAISDRAEAISNGGLEDFAAYKFEAGFINGLRAAKALAEETEREFDT